MLLAPVDAVARLLLTGPTKLANYSASTSWTFRLAAKFNVGRALDLDTLMQVVAANNTYGERLRYCCETYIKSAGLSEDALSCVALGQHSEERKEIIGHLKQWLSVAALCDSFRNFMKSRSELCGNSARVHAAVLESSASQAGSVVVEEYLHWIGELEKQVYNLDMPPRGSSDVAYSPPPPAKRHEPHGGSATDARHDEECSSAKRAAAADTKPT